MGLEARIADGFMLHVLMSSGVELPVEIADGATAGG
jgi:hypothetical protein